MFKRINKKIFKLLNNKIYKKINNKIFKIKLRIKIFKIFKSRNLMNKIIIYKLKKIKANK